MSAPDSIPLLDGRPVEGRDEYGHYLVIHPNCLYLVFWYRGMLTDAHDPKHIIDDRVVNEGYWYGPMPQPDVNRPES